MCVYACVCVCVRGCVRGCARVCDCACVRAGVRGSVRVCPLRRRRVPVPVGLCQRHLSELGGLVHLQDLSPGLRGVPRRGAL